MSRRRLAPTSVVGTTGSPKPAEPLRLRKRDGWSVNWAPLELTGCSRASSVSPRHRWLAERVYRALLLLYPASFRARNGEEMLRLFLEKGRDEGRRAGGF